MDAVDTIDSEAGERLIGEDRQRARHHGGDTFDVELLRRGHSAGDRLLTVGTMNDELRKQRIESRLNGVTGTHTGIPPHSEAAGHIEDIDASRGRQESATGILGVDAQLDRMTDRLRSRLQRQTLTESDAELLGDEIDSGGHLGDGVLDLQTGVDLEERHGAVGGEQELDGAGTAVVHLGADGFGRTVQTLALLIRQTRGRCFLDEFLIASLGGAVTVTDSHDPALTVADDLDLDMARTL